MMNPRRLEGFLGWMEVALPIPCARSSGGHRKNNLLELALGLINLTFSRCFERTILRLHYFNTGEIFSFLIFSKHSTPYIVKAWPMHCDVIKEDVGSAGLLQGDVLIKMKTPKHAT